MLEPKILKEYHIVAIVGLSPDPNRPSHKVAAYLAQHDYEIIPVNPDAHEILGRPSYPDLQSLPQSVDIVDIFRRSEEVMPVVDEAIKIGAKVVWMQEGVINETAAARARDAGLLVVMDKCMYKEHQRLSKDSASERRAT
ncbi:MAG: CoA-binding protein [Deltaproteobacteria bacterium]|nr:MAG: CoA-binding protein [Deltaproteobacteria bacterium]